MIQKNPNLRTKLMFIFLFLALVPLAAIGWFSVSTTEELIASMVFHQLQNVAVDKIALLEHWLAERKADLTVISETSIIKSMNPELMGPYLELIRSNYGVYKDITVVSASGDIVFSTPGMTLQRNSGDPPDFPNRTSLFMSDISHFPKEKESTFYIAAPILNDDGSLSGTIYGRVGTSKIVFFILNVSLGKTGECYLVEKDGRFLAHKDPFRILTENISQTDSFRNIFQKRDRREAYLDYRGIQVLGTSLNVRGTNWYIVVEQDKEEAFHSAKTLKRILYVTIFLGMGSALALTWIVSSHMIKPIRLLSRYAEAAGESEFDQKMAPLRRKDEIGMLYREFEKMVQKLKERQNNLEQKVVLREAELKESDIILKKTRLIAERSEKFAAMGRMGAAVAHEIRTPLTSLKLFLESVQDQIEKSPEDEEDFKIAMAQIKRMEGAINRFLDFTKPQDLIVSEIDVRALIDDVMFMIKPLANRQECTLIRRVDEGLPNITGDKKLLTEALINLLVNALEAISDHGTVTITSSKDYFDENQASIPCVRIDIHDTGPGISGDQIENIFDPFLTTKASGTGLGLPLVLNTVKSHGGVIRVTSKINQGATFSLFLPLYFNRSLHEQNGENTNY